MSKCTQMPLLARLDYAEIRVTEQWIEWYKENAGVDEEDARIIGRTAIGSVVMSQRAREQVKARGGYPLEIIKSFEDGLIDIWPAHYKNLSSEKAFNQKPELGKLVTQAGMPPVASHNAAGEVCINPQWLLWYMGTFGVNEIDAEYVGSVSIGSVLKASRIADQVQKIKDDRKEK